MEAQAKLYIQDKIRKGYIELAASYMLLYENNKNPFEMRMNSISEFINHYTEAYVDFKNHDIIKESALNIMKTGIKYKDACHLACAIYANCEYFITTDKRLLKYKSDKIKLVNSIDFIDILEE